MGTVHKFPRPPKNRRQFEGYRPAAAPAARRGKPARWRVPDRYRGLLAWTGLILLAVALWALGRVL